MFSLNDVNPKQLLLKRDNDIKIESFNEHLFVRYQSKNKKMSTKLIPNKDYHLIVAIDDNEHSVKVYLDDLVITLNNSNEGNITKTNDKHTFQLGGKTTPSRENVYDGMNGYLGAINIYNDLVSFSDFSI